MSDIYDLIIIGGGINGAGIARDAAGRGMRVLLLERGDLAQGTSSASTKLIHGGLRYLEHYEFGLVREALSEREKLWSIAPHIIHPLRFVLPYRTGLRPRWLLRLGLFLYDHIGGRKELPPTRSITLAQHPAGPPLKPIFTTGFEYSDGWVDDARLVVLNARDAVDHGAEVRTRCEVTALSHADGVWRVTTAHEDFAARAIINAGGPSVLDLYARAGVVAHKKMRLVRGSHIVVRRLFEHDYAYFFQLPDGRIFFAIPYERDFTLIGTTDLDHPDAQVAPQASAEEIAYLCEGASQYFARAISPEDVVWTYSGVRPLIDDGSGKPESATRGYTFDVSGGVDGAPVMLSVFGGKITTYRHLATDALALLAEHMPVSGATGGATGGAADWTAHAPLPGGDFPMHGLADLMDGLARDYPFLPPATVDRVARAYGTKARDWLGQAEGLNDLGPHFGAGLTGAEVDYLMTQEWAQTAQDVLWRRSKLGLRMDGAGVNALEAYMAAKLGAKTHAG